MRAYPGNVHIIVSGTAASAATVLATAADRLEMTPGSLWMIHDPSVMAWGNERDLEEAIRLLRACKESILNVYGRRCRKARDEVGAMMRDTTWMDAGAALQDGFIDGIVDMGSGIINAALFVMRRASPKPRPRSPRGWSGSRPKRIRNADKQQDAEAEVAPVIAAQQAEPQSLEPQQAEPEREAPTEAQPATPPGVPVAQLQKRLALITPTKR